MSEAEAEGGIKIRRTQRLRLLHIDSEIRVVLEPEDMQLPKLTMKYRICTKESFFFYNGSGSGIRMVVANRISFWWL